MRKRFVYLLLVLFVVGVVFRVWHFPFRESAVLRVIPADAVVMSRHISPGARWSQALREGLFDPWLLLAGEDSEHPGADLADDPGIAWLFSQLGARYLATAYVERFAGRPAPAFIMSAWVGGRFTHVARMGFLDDAFRDFRVKRGDDGSRIWYGYFPDFPRGFEHISFGVYEGVAFGVATDYSFGAERLYQIMRRQARSEAQVLLSQVPDRLLKTPDRIRVRTPIGQIVNTGVVMDQPRVLRKYVSMSLPRVLDVGVGVPSTLSDLLAVVHPTAAAIAGTTAGSGLQLVEALPFSSVVHDVVHLIFTHVAGRQTDGALVAWLASRDYGGRMLRLRVPAVGVALELSEDQSVKDIVSPILQRLTARYQISWGVEPYGERGVVSLIPPTGNWYGQLSRGDRAGFAVWDGFFFMHSSAAALDSLLEHFGRNMALDPFPLPGGATLFMRVDGMAMADVLRLGFSSYALWQVIDGQKRDHVREVWLQQLGDTMAAYSHAELVIQDDPEGVDGVLIVELLERGGSR